MTRKDDETVSPETLTRLAAAAERANGGEGIGNLLAAIGNNVDGAIAERETEVAGLVKRVRELNHEIAVLKTHAQIGTPASAER